MCRATPPRRNWNTRDFSQYTRQEKREDKGYKKAMDALTEEKHSTSSPTIPHYET